MNRLLLFVALMPAVFGVVGCSKPDVAEDSVDRSIQVKAPKGASEGTAANGTFSMSKAEIEAALKHEGFRLQAGGASSDLEITKIEESKCSLYFAMGGGRLVGLSVQQLDVATKENQQRMSAVAAKLASLLMKVSQTQFDAELAAAMAKPTEIQFGHPTARHEFSGNQVYCRIIRFNDSPNFYFSPSPFPATP